MDKNATAHWKNVCDFLNQIMQDQNEKTADRLKASEILVRTLEKWSKVPELSAGAEENPFDGLSTDELRKLLESDDPFP